MLYTYHIEAADILTTVKLVIRAIYWYINIDWPIDWPRSGLFTPGLPPPEETAEDCLGQLSHEEYGKEEGEGEFHPCKVDQEPLLEMSVLDLPSQSCITCNTVYGTFTSL